MLQLFTLFGVGGVGGGGGGSKIRMLASPRFELPDCILVF